MVYRRFGYLQARLLLEKQEELRRLEGQLDDLDKAEAQGNISSLTTMESRAFRTDGDRRKLMCKIEKCFSEYGRYKIYAYNGIAI